MRAQAMDGFDGVTPPQVLGPKHFSLIDGTVSGQEHLFTRELQKLPWHHIPRWCRFLWFCVHAQHDTGPRDTHTSQSNSDTSGWFEIYFRSIYSAYVV